VPILMGSVIINPTEASEDLYALAEDILVAAQGKSCHFYFSKHFYQELCSGARVRCWLCYLARRLGDSSWLLPARVAAYAI
jgi:hypothetical protein